MGMAEQDAGNQVTPAQSEPGTPPPATSSQGITRRHGKSLLREMVETLLLTAVLFFIARGTVQPFRVDGHSMDPTLHDTEFILVDKVSYHIGQPQRGDIVVFKFPGDTTRDFIKRVIGLPGDTVDIKNATVYVNGTPLPESYIPSTQKPDYTFP